ncbi:hypothetical protein TKK_0013790 [Trichogramma kaykai]|uniref:SWIM-type domain-containing protein n=1 Tax=Trichogramma kaykai TaxID=54128 RepID=A0ABD2WHJ9_9HYME
MDIILRTGFASITHDLSFWPEAVKHGKNLAISGHINNVSEETTFNDCKVIRAFCIKTKKIRETPYNIEVWINNLRHLTNAKCNCLAGITSDCKHIYATIYFINNHRSLSKTSFDQTWGKPSEKKAAQEKYAQPMIVKDHYNEKRKLYLNSEIIPYSPSLSDVIHTDSALKRYLEYKSINKNNLFIKGLLYNLANSVVDNSHNEEVSNWVNYLLRSSWNSKIYYVNLQELDVKFKNFYKDKIIVSDEDIIAICLNTQAQSKCTEWFSIRKLRISASSKAHRIKTCKKNAYELLANTFVKEDGIVNSKKLPSLEYGLKNESIAINTFCDQYNFKVIQIGAFIMPVQPWLVVSVDGLVLNKFSNKIEAVLEIKCPSTCKLKPIWDENTKKFNVGYLQVINNSVVLKESHVYYTQCQVLMYATGLMVCYFFVWSPKGSCLVKVVKNEKFLSEFIPTMKKFYYYYYMKELFTVDQEQNKENTPKN